MQGRPCLFYDWIMERKINRIKPIEVIIEYPLSVLSKYRGHDNLDETWDDNIMPIIAGALLEHNVHIKESRLAFITNIENHKKLMLSMVLIVPPPLFSFAWIVNALKEKNYEKGLCIKNKTDYGDYEIICDLP